MAAMDSLILNHPNEQHKYLIAVINESANIPDTSDTEEISIPAEALVTKLNNRVPSKAKLKAEVVTEIPEEEIQGVGNPIGMLQELCMLRRWMPPDYITQQEQGLPHERQFTIECKVRNMKEYGILNNIIGVGRSKKLAKRQAAYKMVKMIVNMPIEDETSINCLDEDDEIIDRFSMQKIRNPHAQTDISKRVSLFHKNMKHYSGNRLQQMKKIEDIRSISPQEAIEWLEEFAQENKLELTHVNIEEKSKNDKFMVLVTLSTMPTSVCHGSGDTAEEALEKASLNLLKHVLLLCK